MIEQAFYLIGIVNLTDGSLNPLEGRQKLLIAIMRNRRERFLEVADPFDLDPQFVQLLHAACRIDSFNIFTQLLGCLEQCLADKSVKGTTLFRTVLRLLLAVQPGLQVKNHLCQFTARQAMQHIFRQEVAAFRQDMAPKRRGRDYRAKLAGESLPRFIDNVQITDRAKQCSPLSQPVKLELPGFFLQARLKELQ